MKTSAQVRADLVRALAHDLVGPGPDDHELAEEVIPSAPSLWYLTGFLAPFEAPHHERQGDDAEGELDAGDKRVGKGDDEGAPEAAAARRGYFPASIGISLIVPAAARGLAVELTWGDYAPRDPAPDDARHRSRRADPWRRAPRRQTLTIPLDPLPTAPLPVPDSGGLEIVVNARTIDLPGLPPGARTLAVFLVNRRPPVDGPTDLAWCFQARLRLRADAPLVARPDLRRGDRPDGTFGDWDEEVAALHYRDSYEYAVGHNTAVRPLPEPHGGPCFAVETAWIPVADVEKVVPADVDAAELGMEALAAAAESPDTLTAALDGLALAYGAWIEDQAARFAALPGAEATVAELNERARVAARRIAEGVDLLRRDPDARLAFGLANRAIATALRQRATHGREGADPAAAPAPRWRPFQLAFLLLNLQGIADPHHPDRRVVDLLFFPTGGGKTEAYLGLAAFALVLRRLRRPGLAGAGVGVLMRYTLRLLTLDQLGRAATLICALELLRQQDPARLGLWPFEIGLWVGMAATPNAMGHKGDSRPTTARARVRKHQTDPRRFPSPLPIDVCPWCGTKLNPRSFRLTPDEDRPQNLEIRCVHRDCRFTGNHALPIVAVDEPLYRRLPAFLIATVDKFASLPWVGESGVLLGGADRSDSAGFYGPAEPRPGRRLPAPLAPPELIIQDELHLISGPLGTMVGLYETALDALATAPGQGRPIAPKIIASTATVRRADRQIAALFARAAVDIFPPPGPDRRDAFFARTAAASEAHTRQYLGVAAQGRSQKVILLRAYLALMAAAQRAWLDAGGAKAPKNPADPYMTLVGYFNSLRELGGSRRIVEDEINARLAHYRELRRRLAPEAADALFADRTIDHIPQELTSRVSTSDVADAKRRLALDFTAKERVDVVLATNMISVGLDITRLGLMVVLGQPKSAAEYIQATSRVGRDEQRPGLVVTLLNIHRPRDRSHYERFTAWHDAFYRAVEATSVTPFSRRARDRGLAPVVVALARHRLPDLTPNLAAAAILTHDQDLDFIAAALADRAERHDPRSDRREAAALRQEVFVEARQILDAWKKLAADQALTGAALPYAGEARALLHIPGDPELSKIPPPYKKFTAARSLRDVEDAVDLWVRSPDDLSLDALEEDDA